MADIRSFSFLSASNWASFSSCSSSWASFSSCSFKSWASLSASTEASFSFSYSRTCFNSSFLEQIDSYFFSCSALLFCSYSFCSDSSAYSLFAVYCSGILSAACSASYLAFSSLIDWEFESFWPLDCTWGAASSDLNELLFCSSSVLSEEFPPAPFSVENSFVSSSYRIFLSDF